MAEAACVCAFVAGLGLIVAGVALWSVPLALVVGGVELAAVATAYSRGGEGGS